MIGWLDGRMVSGRLVGRPDSRTVGWSVGGRSGGQLGRWSDGPGWLSGWMVTRSGGRAVGWSEGTSGNPPIQFGFRLES